MKSAVETGIYDPNKACDAVWVIRCPIFPRKLTVEFAIETGIYDPNEASDAVWVINLKQSCPETGYTPALEHRAVDEGAVSEVSKHPRKQHKHNKN